MNEKTSLKIFCTGSEQNNVVDHWQLAKQDYIIYPGFLIAHVSAKVADEIVEEYVVEDITSQFEISFDGCEVRDAEQALKTLDNKAHHFLVQFQGPIKSQWISALRKKGVEFREPYKTFTYIVRCNKKQLEEAMGYQHVRKICYLPTFHRDKVKLEALQLDDDGIVSETLVVEFFNPDDMSKGRREIKKIGKLLGNESNSEASIVATRKSDGVISVRVTGTGNRVMKTAQSISQIHGVRVVRQRVRKNTKNDVAADIMDIDLARGLLSDDYEEGYELTGKGEIVAVCDSGFDIGRVDDVHPDFEGRVKAIKSYPISDEDMDDVYNARRDSGAADISGGHGTHVAGSILGSGAASKDMKGIDRPIRGIAYEAELVFQAVEQEMAWRKSQYYKDHGRFYMSGLEDITDILSYAHRKGARIHSNSWGGGWPGEYDNTCRLVDKFMWDHKDFTVVVCAGNEGSDEDFEGQIKPTSIQSPAPAKNCITVGASESLRTEFSDQTYGKRWPKFYPVKPFWDSPMANNPYQVIAFSSRGPTNDGRIKPDIVAPGSYILSTRSRAIPHEHKGWGSIPGNLDYFYLGGTSMATPLVSGVCALLRQYYKEIWGLAKPSSALLKATLIGGAIKLPNYSPAEQHADNHQGYGRVNLRNMVYPAAPGEVVVYDALNMGDREDKLRTGDFVQFSFEVESSQVPLRISMAYTDFPGDHLVNNLNMLLFRVDKENQKKHYHVGYGETANNRKPDAVNNTELIDIKRPEPGKWVLQVIASNVPRGPQDFALFFSGHFKNGMGPEKFSD